LTAIDEVEAEVLANQLLTINSERRDIEKNIEAEAFALLEEEMTEHISKQSIVVYQANWHKGVVGIVAARLVDHYYKPSIVLALSGDKIVGSARTAGQFNIHAALEQCQDLLLTFGGHHHAAGLTLDPTQLGAFIDRFETVVAQMMKVGEEQPIQHIDAVVDLELLTPSFWNILRQFEPFGPKNMRPVFATKGIRDTGYSTVLKEKHLKLKVKQKKSKTYTGIGFNLGHYFPMLQEEDKVDICYVLEENTYRNRTSLQLNVRDVRQSER
jgi:single-stranded-DNA-specific exonuclease